MLGEELVLDALHYEPACAPRDGTNQRRDFRTIRFSDSETDIVPGDLVRQCRVRVQNDIGDPGVLQRSEEALEKGNATGGWRGFEDVRLSLHLLAM